MGRTRSFQSPAPGPDARWSVHVASAKRRVPGSSSKSRLTSVDTIRAPSAQRIMPSEWMADPSGSSCSWTYPPDVGGAEDQPGPEEAGAAVAGLLGTGDGLAAGDVGADAPRVVAPTPPVADLGALAVELDPAVDPARLVVAAVVLVDPTPDAAEVLVLLVGVEGGGPLEVERHAAVAAALEREAEPAERVEHLGPQRPHLGDLGRRVEQLRAQRPGDAHVVLAALAGSPSRSRRSRSC